MAKLRYQHIAGKNHFFDSSDATGTICDYCDKQKINLGDKYWHIIDGFGYNQCKSCYIKELEDEILDIDWIKEKNKDIRDKINRLQGLTP